jgi:hypothetical protein
MMTSPIAARAKGYEKELNVMAQITTAEMASELGTDGRTLRKFLRSITPKEEQPGKGSRWVLEGNKRDISKMRKQFSDWTAAQEKPAEEETPEVEAEVDGPTDAELDEIEA